MPSFVSYLVAWCHEGLPQEVLEKQTQNVFLACKLPSLRKSILLLLGTSGIGEAMVDFIEWFHSSDFGKR